jgi:hypothetical protein
VPSGTVQVLYGNTSPTACKLCGKTHTRFGTLIDPNGHAWLVCNTCIDNLWSGNAAFIVDSEIEDRAKQLVQERLMGMPDNER